MDTSGAPARIAMVINSLQRGGAETQFLRVARALLAAGHEVRIFTILADNDFTADLDGLPVTQFASRPGPRTVTGAVSQLRAWRPDVVLNFLYQATVVGRIAAAASRTPAVISSMRNERLESRLRGAVFRATQRLDTVTTTNSPRAAATIEASGTVRRGSLRVIPNGLDVTRLAGGDRARIRAELGLADDVVLFLGIGRLVPQKDWPTLVDAIARYTGPPAHWAIAGDGPGGDELTAALAAAGVSDRVTLLGLRNDVVDLLAGSDALVLCSTYEGLPNAVLEAMAARRPVVATRVGDCPSLVRPEFGRLVDVGDAAGLAAALADVAALDPAARAVMGEAAHVHAAATYDLDSVGQLWVELVDEVLQRAARTRRRAVRPSVQPPAPVPAPRAAASDRTSSEH